MKIFCCSMNSFGFSSNHKNQGIEIVIGWALGTDKEKFETLELFSR